VREERVQPRRQPELICSSSKALPTRRWPLHTTPARPALSRFAGYFFGELYFSKVRHLFQLLRTPVSIIALPDKQKTITIFLASSSELKEVRDAFDLYFRQQNDSFLDQGLYLKIVRWEKFLDAMGEEGLQKNITKRCAAAISSSVCFSPKPENSPRKNSTLLIKLLWIPVSRSCIPTSKTMRQREAMRPEKIFFRYGLFRTNLKR
jgi:hypothetical protein